MKKDIDSLMQANNIDALLVMGSGQHNPTMVYLTGGGHLTSADLIKPLDKKGILFHGSMERDEAAKSGLETHSYDRYPYLDLKLAARGDPGEIMALRYVHMFEDAGISSGNVAIYGEVEIGPKFSVLNRVQALLPDIKFIGYFNDPIFMTAMMTKDQEEVDRIHRMGKVTTSVVRRVANFLQFSPVLNETLQSPDKKALTIGDIRRKINLWLAEEGVENPHGTIFSIGHDAGVPHSQGDDNQPITLGKTIVFDIYPCEAGGGYYYDFTRTWSLSYASPEVSKAYEQVKTVYDSIVSELTIGQLFSHYQKRTCEMFENLGHITVLTNPATMEGYVHSLGHGVGLRLHEMPFSGATATPIEKLVPGCVFTIEPGLYYPSRNFGIRIEDTYQVTTEGTFEKLADYPYDLVLPIKHA